MTATEKAETVEASPKHDRLTLIALALAVISLLASAVIIVGVRKQHNDLQRAFSHLQTVVAQLQGGQRFATRHIKVIESVLGKIKQNRSQTASTKSDYKGALQAVREAKLQQKRGNVVATTTHLAIADSLLVSSGNNQVQQVKKMIQLAIEALAKIQPVAVITNKPATNETFNMQDWHSWWPSMKKLLAKYVVIRHHAGSMQTVDLQPIIKKLQMLSEVKQ